MLEIKYDDGKPHNSVQVSATFSNWEPVDMERIGDTAYVASFNNIPQARVHMYKFIVDGHWCLLEGRETVEDRNGNINHVVNTVDTCSNTEVCSTQSSQVITLTTPMTYGVQERENSSVRDITSHPDYNDLSRDVTPATASPNQPLTQEVYAPAPASSARVQARCHEDSQAIPAAARGEQCASSTVPVTAVSGATVVKERNEVVPSDIPITTTGVAVHRDFNGSRIVSDTGSFHEPNRNAKADRQLHRWSILSVHRTSIPQERSHNKDVKSNLRHSHKGDERSNEVLAHARLRRSKAEERRNKELLKPNVENRADGNLSHATPLGKIMRSQSMRERPRRWSLLSLGGSRSLRSKRGSESVGAPSSPRQAVAAPSAVPAAAGISTLPREAKIVPTMPESAESRGPGVVVTNVPPSEDLSNTARPQSIAAPPSHGELVAEPANVHRAAAPPPTERTYHLSAQTLHHHEIIPDHSEEPPRRWSILHPFTRHSPVPAPALKRVDNPQPAPVGPSILGTVPAGTSSTCQQPRAPAAEPAEATVGPSILGTVPSGVPATDRRDNLASSGPNAVGRTAASAAAAAAAKVNASATTHNNASAPTKSARPASSLQSGQISPNNRAFQSAAAPQAAQAAQAAQVTRESSRLRQPAQSSAAHLEDEAVPTRRRSIFGRVNRNSILPHSLFGHSNAADAAPEHKRKRLSIFSRRSKSPPARPQENVVAPSAAGPTYSTEGRTAVTSPRTERGYAPERTERRPRTSVNPDATAQTFTSPASADPDVHPESPAAAAAAAAARSPAAHSNRVHREGGVRGFFRDIVNAHP